MTRGKKSRSNVKVLAAFLASCRKFAVLICGFARYAENELLYLSTFFLLLVHSDINRLH